MKTDSQLQRDVMDELAWEPRVEHAHIGVAAAGGVITLSGFVSNYAQKLAAERAAKRVAGVHAIAEEIQVRFASEPKTSDPEIAKRILDVFNWDVTIPDDKLDVKVERKGVDRLAASWAEQRKISQIAFGLETRLGARAGFRRNEQMLSLNPRYVVAFAGNGVLERLVIDAKAKRISVVDRRGPLGTNPKLHARQLEAAA
jgi:hypothetical protein